ncbi:MAG: hypothetical protein KA896_15725 [Leptothrix sp. (in: Bacteria)]|nr:hypothetical protein [Leptothrix sp. (in: b-proteobacteria)]
MCSGRQGTETVVENDATAGNSDALRFASDVASQQIWFRQSGNHLEASIIGTADKVVLQNWYLGGAYHVERFEAGNGKVLLDTQVQSLVAAMSAFTPPAVGQTTLPANYQAALQPVLAANWG